MEKRNGGAYGRGGVGTEPRVRPRLQIFCLHLLAARPLQRSCFFLEVLEDLGGRGARHTSRSWLQRLQLTTQSHCALLPGAVLLIMDYMFKVWKPTRNPKRRTHALGGERHK